MTVSIASFVHAHATHPDWRMALALAAAQIDAQRSQAQATCAPTLGWVYFTEPYVAEAALLLADLHARWPGTQWVGGSGVGVLASGIEYMDEPALVLMVSDLDPALFRVFSGTRPLSGFHAGAVQVHADPQATDLPDLLQELAARAESGCLFGAVMSGREHTVQIAEAVLKGGVSGVALHPAVGLISRLTQGCRTIGPVRRITRFERNQVLSLDGRPALSCLLDDLGLSADSLGAAVPRLGTTLAGLAHGDALATEGPDGASLSAAVHLRRLVGVSPGRGGVALAADLDDWPGSDAPDEPALQLAFCRRDAPSAWRDLVRVCCEIRDDLLSDDEAWALSSQLPADPPGEVAADDPTQAWLRAHVAGAIYVSCTGRGGAHFGGPSAELQTVRQALGDVPLVGLFGSGEIAGDQLHAFAGVLTVFLREAA